MRALAALLLAAGAASAAPAPPPAVRAALVAERSALSPGRSATIGVLLSPPPGWHTYWRNPGDAGLPTTVEWSLPAGFTVGELQWPAPERFAGRATIDYGYAGEVLLPVELRAPAGLKAGAEIAVGAKVRWLACKEICVPGAAELRLVLPVRAAVPAADPAQRARFAGARARLPADATGWRARAALDGGIIRLVLSPPAAAPPAGEVLVFAEPASALALADARPASREMRDGELRLALARPKNGPAPARLSAVLVNPAGWTRGGPVAWRVELPVEPAR